MLSDLAPVFPVIPETFSEASGVLGYDLWQLVQKDPGGCLNQTVHTQPALLTASIALWRAYRADRLMPVAMAGHSLGEYSALVAAGALQFQDAVSLVAARGRFMQEAVPDGQGGLAVLVGLDLPAVSNLCETVAEGEVLSPANFNSPGQTVVAGTRTAVERAITAARAAGARMAKFLPVSVPSHCALMKPAAARLAACLAEVPLESPKMMVVNNVDAVAYGDADSIRSGLLRQLSSPVRWVEVMAACHRLGAGQFIECGPGNVLSGLGKRILPAAEWLPAGALQT